MGVNTPALPCAMTSKEQAITMQEQAGQHQSRYGDESQDMALPQMRLGALKAREISMRTIGGRPAGVFPEQRGRREPSENICETINGCCQMCGSIYLNY